MSRGQGKSGVAEPDRGRGNTVLAGLVGRGIQLSRTPAMHEAEGAALGLRYVYKLIDTELMDPQPPAIAEILRATEICGFAGLNITYPYKIDVIAHLDELSDAARTVGAVNTVVFREGKRFGHNTDVWGFGESFRRNMSDVARDRVFLIGAGGAGVAVAHALLQNKVGQLVICDKETDRAEALATRLNQRFGDGRATLDQDPTESGKRFDGIVNATPVGMKKLPGSPFPINELEASTWVADIVYFPIETELLRAARRIGCRTLSGSGMAVFQAVRAFELITGSTPDGERMKATFDAFDPSVVAKAT